jgi:peptidyl-prolyl cis-trans isomerase C
MKYCFFALLFAGYACAQTPPPPPGVPTPQSKPAAPQAAPAPPAPTKPDAVVISFADQKLTAAQVDKLLADFPPQIQQAIRAQPANVLSRIFLFKYWAGEAEKEHIDQQSPYRETLESQRLQTLAQAEISEHRNKIVVSAEDQEKYYKEHPDRFEEANVKVIYIPFSPASEKPGISLKKTLTEADAKTKIDDLRKQIVEGADFGKLARENSEDKASADKDGDFGVIKQDSSYPAPIKNAVLSLKAGDLSEPLRQPNGFYLFKIVSKTTTPYDQVRSQLNETIKEQRQQEWIQELQRKYTLKIEDPDYFRPKAPLQLQPVH